jgi:hypothetical protein
MHWLTNSRHSASSIVSVAAALLLLITLAPQAVLARPRPAVTCEVFPGDSRVTWKSQPQTTRLDLTWYDENGVVLFATTIIPTKAMHSRYSQQTPYGATDFGVDFWDANGVYAVGGLSCT